MNNTDSNVHIFEAGIYAIGDPCYFISNDVWDDLIEETGCFGLDDPSVNKKMTNWDNGAYQYKGKKCFSFGTRYGDGAYPLSMNGKTLAILGVDAGMIGIMPVKCVDLFPKSGVFYHTFDAPFEVYCTQDGAFTFGNIRVETC
jgi:hypothetical protein